MKKKLVLHKKRESLRLWELKNLWAKSMENLNTFVPNAPFLYPLKTSENLTVFWCFQGVEKECIGNKWVKQELISDRKINVALNLTHFTYFFQTKVLK